MGPGVEKGSDMSGSSLVPRGGGGTPIPREPAKALVRLNGAVVHEQAVLRAVSSVTEAAMSEAAYLMRVRGQLEAAAPDAKEALDLIANTTNMNLARIVHRFGSEVS